MDTREYKYKTPILLKISDFDIIGCSPTIRAMETSYYMSLEWNPTNIFIFPHLRECDCYENETIENVNNRYPIKSIDQQKEILRSEPCYNKLNFKYVIDNPLREEPGNIDKFIKWFGENVELPDKETVNVLIITHSHVIARIRGGGISNNSGFILSTTKENDKILYTKDNLMGFWYFNNDLKTKCPIEKCPGLC
jgi:broad specificity phosphatase PhoE